MKHAVVLAGDTRTWEHSVPTLAPFLQDADLYISVWSESRYAHHVSKTKYSHPTINEEEVHRILSPFVPAQVCIEEHDHVLWTRNGYNSNYLHRLRTGIEMVRQSGVEYDSVMLMRPDLFFGPEDNPYVRELKDKVRSVERGQVVTAMSGFMLNDWILAVRPEDMDKVVPTVEQYAPFRHEDWHTFHGKFVRENGMQIVDVEHVPLLILRPPAKEGITYEEAYHNTRIWNMHYIVYLINRDGINVALRAWGPAAVKSAIDDLVESDTWRKPPF